MVIHVLLNNLCNLAIGNVSFRDNLSFCVQSAKKGLSNTSGNFFWTSLSGRNYTSVLPIKMYRYQDYRL